MDPLTTPEARSLRSVSQAPDQIVGRAMMHSEAPENILPDSDGCGHFWAFYGGPTSISSSVVTLCPPLLCLSSVYLRTLVIRLRTWII